LLGCSCKGGHAYDGSEAASIADGVLRVYRVVDRIETAAGGEGVAVLEDPETLQTEERLLKDLPANVESGQVLTDDGIAGGTLRADKEETVARAARIAERFGRLKTD